MQRILTIAFLVSLPLHVSAFADTQQHAHKEAISLLRDQEVVEGYSDGTFRPDASINRAEFLKILMLAVFGESGVPSQLLRCFSDFSNDPQWYYRHACRAKDLGILTGHPDGSFRGEDIVNLAEALAMSFRALHISVEHNEYESWYTGLMREADARGLFQILPNRPEHRLTRGEMAALIVTLVPVAVPTPQSIQDLQHPTSPAPQLPSSPAPSVCGNGIFEDGEQCDDGNVLDGDGCSSLCIIVPEPTRHGALRVTQKSLSDTSVPPGARDIDLVSFDAIAGRQDVIITTLKFMAESGSLDILQNIRLFLDRDGDAHPETPIAGAVRDGNTVSFSDAEILVKDGRYIRAAVRADVRTSASGSVALGFAVSDPNFVEGVDRIDGEDVSGIELNNGDCPHVSICWIGVHTEAARTVTTSTQGGLEVEKD